jgi:hypothetical protein
MRIPMMERSSLDPELQVMLEKWEAEGEIFESWVIAEFIALGKVIRVLDLPFGASANDCPEHAGAARARETGA